MFCDGRIDVESESESGEPVSAGDTRSGAGADACEKRLYFEAEGLAGLDGGFGDVETRELSQRMR